MDSRAAVVTLGPVLFNWPPDRWRDFYFRIADEAPIDTVYLGEVICSKRAPLFDAQIGTVMDRLHAAKKTVVLSTLAEVALNLDSKLVASVCASAECLIEANDVSALSQLRGRPHHIGPFMNVYNERTAAYLAAGGACNFCLPVEMPADTVRAICAATKDLDATFEVLAFGRMPLALSARCYHARAHGRTKDSCQFVCENDPDGLELKTINGQAFLAVNGVQTMSHDFLSLVDRLPELRALGISRFRLSPHSCDMVRVAATFRGVLDGSLTPGEGAAVIAELYPRGSFSYGFYDGGAAANGSYSAAARST